MDAIQGVDPRASIKKKLRNADGVIVGSDVKHTLPVPVYHVRRHAQIEEKRSHVRPIEPRGFKQRRGLAQERGIFARESEHFSLVQAEASGREGVVTAGRSSSGACSMSLQQAGYVDRTPAHRLLVESALGKSAVPGRGGVGVCAMGEEPLGQLEVVVLDRDLKVPASPVPIVSHVEHWPIGVAPIVLPPGFYGELVHELHEPEDVSAKVDVVDDLHVMGLSASLKQQTRQGVALGMRRPVFLAFANNSDQTGISTVTGHEERIGIRPMIQQQASDARGILCGRKDGQASEAQIQERFPSFGSIVPEQIVALARAGPVRSNFRVLLGGGAGLLSENTFHFVQFAAGDGRVKAVPGYFRVAPEQARGGVTGHNVGWTAPDVVIRAGKFQETRRQCIPGFDRARMAGCGCGGIVPGPGLDVLFEFRPALEPVLARHDQLRILERERRDFQFIRAQAGELWMELPEALKGCWILRLASFEQVFSLVFEVVQAGAGRQ